MSKTEPRLPSEGNSVKGLCEAMWQVEASLGLVNLSLKGVKVWQYARIRIYYHLAQITNTFIASQVAPGSRAPGGLFQLLKGTCSSIFKGLLLNPFFHRRVQEILIEHPRRMQHGGEYVDIYTYFYTRQIKQRGITYILLALANRYTSNEKKFDADRRYVNAISWILRLTSRFSTGRFQQAEKTVASRINASLSTLLGSKDVDLTPILESSAIQFKVEYCFYRLLFWWLRPERLIVVVGYVHGAAICAAKDLGIETIELQHGTFSPYHMGYSYKLETRNLDYFPDAFVAWGTFWKDMEVLPLLSDKVSVASFQYFHHSQNKLAPRPLQPNKVLVLSQSVLGEKMANMIYAMRTALSNFEIVYRLHPDEFARWEEYDSLRKLVALPNVRLAKNETLYDNLSEAAYQIGVFSTALYEGVALGCSTILLDLPGVEYMEHLLDKGWASLARDEESLRIALQRPRQEMTPREFSSALFGHCSEDAMETSETP